MRLIDADVFEDLLTKAIALQDVAAKMFDIEDDAAVQAEIKAYMDILDGVREQPTIDRPDIVRCRDCKHRTKRVCDKLEFYECEHIRYQETKCGVTDDWYCADGERSETE